MSKDFRFNETRLVYTQHEYILVLVFHLKKNGSFEGRMQFAILNLF